MKKAAVAQKKKTISEEQLLKRQRAAFKRKYAIFLHQRVLNIFQPMTMK